jgi:hypothetical protein
MQRAAEQRQYLRWLYLSAMTAAPIAIPAKASIRMISHHVLY